MAKPRTHIVYVGGGGDQENEDLVANQGLLPLKNYAQKSAASFTVLFDGLHAKQKKEAESLVGRQVSDFTERNFQNLLTSLENKVASGEIAKGEQLLISIDTHGNSSKQPESCIEFAEPKPKCGMTKEVFRRLVSTATAKGIKLAILNQSCFSGSTIDLGSPNVCAISAATRDTPGYSDFAYRLAKEFPAAKNLEEAFLLGREKASLNDGELRLGTSFPRISTAADEKTFSQIGVLRKYLLSQRKDIDPKVRACETNQPQRIDQFVAHLGDVFSFIQPPENRRELLDPLAASLHQYQDILTQNLALEDEVIALSRRKENAGGGLETFWGDLSSGQLDSELAINAKLVDKSPTFRKRYEGLKRIKNTLPKNPEYQRFLVLKKQLAGVNFERELKPVARKVKLIERKLYDYLYKYHQTQEKNPCSDFLL